ncbi:MAG: GH92 family glycosyl hydrolase [Bacteroidales bacterium]
MKHRLTFPIIITVIFIAAIVAVLVFTTWKHNKEIKNLSVFVDPFIGTGGHGHTYPGASLPFGMVQISPDTRLSGWDGCSGYHYSDTVIYGFSHTHLSGTGVADYCDVLFMPVNGNPVFHNGISDTSSNGYASSFNKSSEKASPGYYAVHLNEPDVFAEFTCTERTAFHKYHYNKPDSVILMIDLVHRNEVINAGIKKINQTDIAGVRRSKSWAQDQQLFFYARFSDTIRVYQVKGNELKENNAFDVFGKEVRAAVGFDTPVENTLYVKVGISAVSIESAKNNLEQEANEYDFDSALSDAKDKWNDELSTILVRGNNTADKVKFYTALYHAFLSPDVFSDCEGYYRGTDKKNHHSGEHTQYTVFSLWDTYRAAHPLFTITQTERTKDFVRTMLKHYEEGGKLPVWELAGNYTGYMIGYHTVPVIYDAYKKGIVSKDEELALEAMQHSATLPHLGLPAWMKKGYIGIEDEHESVSKALEYAFDDWCIAMMAKKTGNNDVYREFIDRAQQYKNHFDPETKLMRPRLNGGWKPDFDPAEVDFNYTEANAWQYSFYVPHDINSWINLMGGKDSLDVMLDRLFNVGKSNQGRHQVDITGLIGQYAHGNEPSHHIAYLYNYCGKPWKTQKRVKQIMNDFYTTLPDGYIGNEDCGQMSAWFVMSAMGFYPVNPANGIYDFGSPLFDTCIIQLENNRRFFITAEKLSPENIYIQSVTLNDEDYNKTYIRHENIMDGGELHFVMGPKPNKQFGNNDEAVYHSEIKADPIVICPVIESEHRVFTDSVKISISSAQKENINIFYTTDGSEPYRKSNLFTGDFYVSESCQIKAIACTENNKSGVVSARFSKLDPNVSLTLHAKYSNQYAAGGDNALIDGIRGGKDFRTGQWQGYQGQDIEAVVDLGSEKTLSVIGVRFLQDIKSWIWIPAKVEILVAGKSKRFTVLADIDPKTDDTAYGQFVESIEAEANEKNIRYIKIRAKYPGTIPDWHPGAGNASWMFADEIYFE